MPDTEERRANSDTSGDVTLGEYLAFIRKDRNLSLRAVEEKTNKQVSNAYLSQIETGKIHQPSPNILHSLAELYQIDFEQLMERAGYITPSSSRPQAARHGRIATFAEHNLTPTEERELMQYLEFIRRRDSDR